MGACLSGSKTDPDPVPASSGGAAPKQQTEKPVDNNSAAEDPLSLNNDDEEPVREEPIEDFYELGKEIGRGGFSVVVEAVEKKTGDKYAIKCIKKTMVEGDDIKLLRREIKIMKRVSHSNILKLFEVFEDEDEFFLVMELLVKPNDFSLLFSYCLL